MEMKNERQIQHPFHEQHPLVLVEEQTKKACCFGCGELISGLCFTCAPCNYHLHLQCAEAPLEIPNHPLHPKHHSGFFLRQRHYHNSDYVYGCALCKEKRNMFFYECNNCYFSLDIKCANLSSSYSKVKQESKHDFHPHKLTLIQNPMAMAMDELKKRFNCTWCHQPLLHDAIYFCFHCPSFVFHKKCLKRLPFKINHPSHHLHPLLFKSKKKSLFCILCHKKHRGYFYSCSLCHFNINIECAWPTPVVEDKSHHQHAFNLFWKQGSFICDACNTEGNYISYICLTCSFTVHKDCIKLPRIIKFSRHAHCLFHKYFLEKQELTRQNCKVCFKKMKLERGSYSCVNAGCNYIVHVNCALENKALFDVIEQENQCEELCASTQSSITCVIEENEDGEATKIQHFSHEGHCLVLADKMEEESDRKCDGCMLPVSTHRFYYCSESECHFCLHKTCVELPRINQHWFRQSNATLQSTDVQGCDLCHQWCSGFFYKIEGIGEICLRCAKVADIIECEGHQHFLFFDFKSNEQPCNGCGRGWHQNGAFRCGKCSFALDFGCLTLPHSALHKCDQHMLYLTYHDDNDYVQHHYCDICEGERNPNLWYYHCSICNTYAHPNCVLGQYPYLKDGTRWPTCYYNPHHHHLLFFKKTEGYPECSYCGGLCQEEVFKCEESTCNYIIHNKCWK